MDGCGYTIGMKTAISIPDEIFEDAEDMAKRLKKSRSQLFSEAMREYLARHDRERVTEELNKVLAEVDDAPDPALAEAARNVLANTEW